MLLTGSISAAQGFWAALLSLRAMGWTWDALCCAGQTCLCLGCRSNVSLCRKLLSVGTQTGLAALSERHVSHFAGNANAEQNTQEGLHRLCSRPSPPREQICLVLQGMVCGQGALLFLGGQLGAGAVGLQL